MPKEASSHERPESSRPGVMQAGEPGPLIYGQDEKKQMEASKTNAGQSGRR